MLSYMQRPNRLEVAKEKCASFFIVSHCVWSLHLNSLPSQGAGGSVQHYQADSWALEKRPSFVSVHATPGLYFSKCCFWPNLPGSAQTHTHKKNQNPESLTHMHIFSVTFSHSFHLQTWNSKLSFNPFTPTCPKLKGVIMYTEWNSSPPHAAFLHEFKAVTSGKTQACQRENIVTSVMRFLWFASKMVLNLSIPYGLDLG